MQFPNLNIQTLFDSQLPDTLAEPILAEIKNICRAENIRIVVLDDDPTGTQTVYDIPVITNWSEGLIRETLKSSPKGFFILTNTRSVPEDDAVAINFQIGKLIKEISKEINCDVLLVSRGDSTLRGHFPAETIALDSGSGAVYNKYLLMPYFKEGGRFTIDNIHYLLEGKELIPIAQTAFAKDKTFGYSSSDLCDYIEEKTSKKINRSKIKAISLEQLNAGVSEAAFQLDKIFDGEYAVVNATCSYHAAIFALALLTQWKKGRKYLVRCSASLVQALFGICHLKLLDDKALQYEHNKNGGLIITGSYVPRSTEQVEHLVSNSNITAVEIDVQKILQGTAANYIESIAESTDRKLAKGGSVLLYTSRELATENKAGVDLKIGSTISEALVNIVKKIKSTPAFIIAKGGITSSDIATKALNMEKAMIAGQLLPGIPVWIQGAEAKFPGMPYIIFPGNVGTPEFMTILYKKLTEQKNN